MTIILRPASREDSPAVTEAFFQAIQENPLQCHYQVATNYNPIKAKPDPLLWNIMGPDTGFIEEQRRVTERTILQAPQKGKTFLVAEETRDRSIKGYVLCGTEGNGKGVIDEIYAVEKTGSRLLQGAIKHLAAHNAKEILADVPYHVTDFFYRNGFRLQGRILPQGNKMVARI